MEVDDWRFGLEKVQLVLHVIASCFLYVLLYPVSCNLERFGRTAISGHGKIFSLGGVLDSTIVLGDVALCILDQVILQASTHLGHCQELRMFWTSKISKLN